MTFDVNKGNDERLAFVNSVAKHVVVIIHEGSIVLVKHKLLLF